MGVLYVGIIVFVLKHLKLELTWATDKQLWTTIYVIQNSYNTKELKNKAVLILHALLCGP